MSQFEFVSVAVALLFSVAIGRLLTALPEFFDRDRRYGVHAGWGIYLLVFSLNAWWGLWSLREVEFDSLRFIAVLSPPAFVVVRVSILCGRSSREIQDYRAHYYEKRIPFFATGLASMSVLMTYPWVFDIGPVGFDSISLWIGISALVVWIIGLVSDRHAIHVVLVSWLTAVTFVNFAASLAFET